MKVTVGISNRHVHLTKEHLNILFGENYQLENVKNLNQPTQFASNSFATLKTNKGILEHVRVIGDLRNYTQVEISKTDAYMLGLNPPIRDSGDLENSEAITLIGPKGEISLNQGCIIANRHIHITPKQMELYGLQGKEEVNVLVNGPKGGMMFHVHLKVSELSYFEMHIDTDDANAFQLKQGDVVTILEGNDESQYLSKM